MNPFIQVLTLEDRIVFHNFVLKAGERSLATLYNLLLEPCRDLACSSDPDPKNA